MEANAKIIAGLEQLEAALSAPENKEWLASRKEIGQQIDPEAADVTWQARPVLDPYGFCENLPEQIRVSGAEYFARTLGTEDWVCFDDLPKAITNRLRRRIKAGHFNTYDDSKPNLGRPQMLGVNFNPNQPKIIGLDDRVAPRTSFISDGTLIVKPADPEEMIYLLSIFDVKAPDGQREAMPGWISARAAKRLFPLIKVGSIAAHFVEQCELRPMRDLGTLLRHSA